TLNYSDCTKDYITMADNGDIVSSESQKIDKDGYFLYSAEKKTLSWEGSSEEDCKQCLFEKIETAE
ncbi:MAG: hypothetical protein K6F52_08235, partial [Clostridia bacterium]|nr:hypothetical protein [Clostridia bacterium]